MSKYEQYLLDTFLHFPACTHEEPTLHPGVWIKCGKPAVVIMRWEDSGDVGCWPACVEHLDPHEDIVTLAELADLVRLAATSGTQLD